MSQIAKLVTSSNSGKALLPSPLFYPSITDKILNATRRTDQLSRRSQVMGQFRLYPCKGLSGTAALHIICNQASKMCQENWPKTK